jgi:pimeloyl-ACP methyl ester carboxylesterase
MYPAREPGVTARHVEVQPGLRLRVVEAGPAGGRPVVLLHGLGASVYSYRAAIPALAAAGHRVVAADLPGHGLSDAPRDLAWYSREAMVASAAALLDTVDARNALLVGVSMGGGIAALLAVAHHPRVARVALINPVGLGRVRLTGLARALAPLPLRRYASRFVTRGLVRWALHRAYADPSRVSARDVDEHWAAASQPGVAPAVVALLHGFSWRPLSDDAWRGIACPVLLLLGTRDRLIVSGAARATRIPGVQIVRLEGGHALNEERPGDVNAALLRFAHE